MPAQNELLNRIDLHYKKMSKSQKKLAVFIREDPEKAVMITAARMGEIVGISESTVVRFATTLGYKGYPELQKALEELVRNSMNTVQRLEAANDRMQESDILKKVLSSDAANIRRTAENIRQKDFDEAVSMILKARKIYIIGVRSCAPLSSFLAYYLNLVFENVHQLNTSTSSELYEQLVTINQEDVIIGISFPRYSNRTQKALEFAASRGAKVIAITDNDNSPLCQYASSSLNAFSDMASVVDSLTAPLSVINALLAAIFRKKEKDVIRIFTELEHIWGEYQVYEENDLNSIHSQFIDTYKQKESNR